jgi:membrane-associated protease RseP (regulator of RpoE activity)
VSAPANEVTALSNFVGTRSPAQVAGVRPGDLLLGVDGKQLPIGQLIADVEQHAGDRLQLMVERGGHDLTVAIRPVDGRTVKVEETNGQTATAKTGSSPVGIIGVELSGTVYQTANPLVAVGRAGRMLGSVTAGTATGIAQVFSLHGLGDFAHQVASAGHNVGSSSSAVSSSSGGGQGGQIMSTLGAAELAVQAAKRNISELLYILVAINIFVGMVNLFPMLPLDGGHVAIAVYERVRSRRGRRYHADVAKLMPVAYLFLLFIVVLGIGALYVNILHPVSLPGG